VLAALGFTVLLGSCSGHPGSGRAGPALQLREANAALSARLFGLRSRYGEAEDTMVRNRVLFAVYCTIVQGDAVPTDYGMFTEEGDASVRAAVAAFVRTARGAAARLSPRQRIDALWGDAWGRDVLVSKSDCSSLR